MSWSCGLLVVLVDEAAEPVASSDDVLAGLGRWFGRIGRDELEGAVGPLGVVVVDVDAQDVVEVGAVEDQQPVP